MFMIIGKELRRTTRVCSKPGVSCVLETTLISDDMPHVSVLDASGKLKTREVF